ncbi:MAG: hypothetical protein PHT47_05290 [Candidatus Cloacimonetes bacterium]|nr:hypothetical protein [Candidatus Cloacimonadota bacterium]MDD4806331.1 hypothetical protein [Candidatus Cloacimonadota bacterium]
MRCKKCNARLAAHDLWCVSCGSQSPAVKTDLASMPVLKNTWSSLSGHWSEFVPVSGLSIILGIIPMAAITYILSFVISLENMNDIQYLLNLLIKSVLFSIFLPFVLIPFSLFDSPQSYSLKRVSITTVFSSYGRYFVFSLINALFFALVHVVCFGLPGFASDPILRLVWIVLLNYWIAIVLPAPVLMETQGLSPFKAITKSYRHFHDVRWNIYLLSLVLSVLNLLAFGLAIFPLLFTLPLSYFAVRDYTLKLIEFELLEYRIV